MTYRERHAKAAAALFEGFDPDTKGARNPQTVILIARLAAQGLYSYEIAERIGVSPKAIQKTFRRYNFPRLYNLEPPLREERIGWAGGMKLMKGYEYVRTPDHPNGTKYGSYVGVHRLVMEQKLGRFLLKTEVVDHIDGNIRNNHPDNLRVYASNTEHLRDTLKGRCPNWTDDGKRRLREARSQPRRMWKGRRIEPIPAASGNGVDLLP